MSADDFEIHVTEVSQSEITNLIRGYLLLRGERLSFSAVAYGRYGGQNVSPQLSPKAKRRLRELGINLEDFELQMQQKLMQGDMIVEPKEG